jgi:hypothetical protein
MTLKDNYPWELIELDHITKYMIQTITPFFLILSIFGLARSP